MRMSRSFIRCAWLLAAGTALAQRPMTLVDIMNLPLLSDPQLSPNGREVAFVESRADWKADRRITHIWKINADGSGLIQMTSGAEGENSPRWSPDGKTIAFLRRASGAETFAQVWLISLAGGEARPLTSHASAVTSIEWSPDESTIFFRAPDPKTEEEKAREKQKDDVFAFDETYQQQQLWSIAVVSKKETRITQGNFSVLSYRLSADGRKIVYHRAPTPLIEDQDQSEVWVANADGTQATEITHNKVQESDAELSPDASKVLFLSGANRNFETYYNRKVFVAPASGGAAKLLTPDLPYEVEKAEWSRDGKSIFFLANMGVHSELFRMPAAGGQPEQITSGKHAIAGWSMAAASGEHVFTATEPSRLSEVWIMQGGAPRQVTSLYRDLDREFKLPRSEAITWKGADGVTVEGLLYYPLDYQEGTRYPLAVQTHGGPQASDKYGMGGGQNYVPVLAAKGYAVLQPNYRGSTGYGDDFLRDMVGHYFKNAHLDVLAGVDAVIQKGVADPDHMIKMGWSGGGHMTDKIITFTDRFKAASAGAGAADWISMYAQSDVRTYRTPWFGGTPWQENAPISVYWDNSPLKDVWKVKTPTIFLVGQNDVRVPEPQSVEMYRALKSNGIPTHLYVAPREPHGWTELRHVLFKMNVELDWFEKYNMNRPYTWEKAPAE